MRIVLAALLAASAATAESLRGSVTLGTGVARDGLGFQLELGAGHFTGFAAVGKRPNDENGSAALGARWSLRPDGSGFGLSLQGSVGIYRGSGLYDARETLTYLAATAHWRWLIDRLVIDVGAGPAVSFWSYRYPSTDYGALDGTLARKTCWGICDDLGSAGIPFDVELGIGLAF